MRLSTLKIKNFLRLQEAELNLLEQGPVLVVGENQDDGGSNGAGKSTLLDAIVWALYGTTVRGVRGTHVCLRGQLTEVSLVVHLGPATYEISRRVEKGKHTIEVTREDTPVISGYINESQKALEQLLGMSKDVFTNSVFVGQGIVQSFSSLTSAQQKEVFEGVLNLGLLSEARDRVKEKSSSLFSSQVEWERKFEKHEEKKQFAQQQIEQAQGQSKQFALQQAKKIMELQGKLEEAERAYELSVTEDIEHLQKICTTYGAQCRVYNILFLDEVCNLALRARAEELRVAAEEIYRQIEHYERDIKGANQTVKQYQDLLAQGKCGVCGSALEESEVPSYLGDAEKLVQDIQGVFDDYSMRYSASQEIYENFLKDIVLSIRDTVTRARSDIGYLRQTFDHNRKVILQEREQSIQRMNIQLLQSQIEQERAAVNPHLETIAMLQKNIEDFEKEKLFAHENACKCKEEGQYFDFWVEGFGQSGMRSYYLRKVTPYLNARVQYYISRLLPGATVEFQTVRQLASGEMRDNFHVEIALQYGAEDFKAASGGEKQCINVAVALAMQDLCSASGGQGIGLSMMDEVCTDLDTVRSARVAQLLCELTERGTILVISNNEELKPFFQKRVTIVKQNGESRLAA